MSWRVTAGPGISAAPLAASPLMKIASWRPGEQRPAGAVRQRLGNERAEDDDIGRVDRRSDTTVGAAAFDEVVEASVDIPPRLHSLGADERGCAVKWQDAISLSRTSPGGRRAGAEYITSHYDPTVFPVGLPGSQDTQACRFPGIFPC